MIIQEKTQVQELIDTRKVYEIFTETPMTTTTGDIVMVLQLQRTVMLQELEQRIVQLTQQIVAMEIEKAAEQAILDQINLL